MTDEQPKDPLHGLTLEAILTDLVDRHGWEWLGKEIEIKCFTTDPSISSSLKFLRRTPWARKKVEDLYVKGPKAGRPKSKRRKPGNGARLRKQGT
jgi:uncharacterized protein (DUF2132 family)